MRTLHFVTPRGFSLQAASDFYAGFTPGSGMAVADPTSLTLAFRLDRTFQAVAVSLRHEGDKIAADVEGTEDDDAVRAQVARMLGLDVDGEAWLDVGRRDPVVGGLQRSFPGFFTAAKPSPYDAAVWGIVSPRLQMAQAARLKIGLATQHGDVVTLHGKRHAVFPSPTELLKVESFPGLSAEKMLRLHGIAHAALAGTLDAEKLRGMDPRAALQLLETLPGVGPWTASHILYRGAAVVDALPTAEPRVLHGLAAAYGLGTTVDVDTYLEIGERWRPFRMWVCILLARHLGRVGGWHNPALKSERAQASRRPARASMR